MKWRCLLALFKPCDEKDDAALGQRFPSDVLEVVEEAVVLLVIHLLIKHLKLPLFLDSDDTDASKCVVSKIPQN